MRKAIFLDKDGVINRLIERKDSPDGHVTSPWTLEEFIHSLYPNVKESIQKLKNLDYYVFVVTNQPGVLAGNMYMDELDKICAYIEIEFGVDHVLYALNKDSNLYKPNNGMIESLISTYDVERQGSYMVGDRWKDIVPGHNSELKTILVNSFYQYNPPLEYIHIKPDVEVLNLDEAVKIIENGVK